MLAAGAARPSAPAGESKRGFGGEYGGAAQHGFRASYHAAAPPPKGKAPAGAGALKDARASQIAQMASS
jgi:hypothetical protein